MRDDLSRAKLSALSKARAARQAAEPRTAPVELAQYLGVNEASVRRWVKREKMPLQATLDAIANWRRVKKAGL